MDWLLPLAIIIPPAPPTPPLPPVVPPVDIITGSPLGVFISSFGVAAFAGVAALLRGGSKVTTTGLASAVMNSGLVGLGISLLWYHKFQDNVYFLIGVCVLAGLGGSMTVDFIMNALKTGGFTVKLGKNGDVTLPGMDVQKEEQK